MKKKHYSWISMAKLLWRSKLLKTMRLTLFAILVSVVQIFATNAHAQQTLVSLNLKNTSIRNVLGQIESQSDFYFIYNAKAIDVERVVSIEVENKSIPEILDKIFEGTNVTYKIDKRQIAISTDLAENAGQQAVTVSGRVTDSSGQPLPGVTVVLKGTTQGTITDSNGSYSLANVSGDAVLIFSFVGMKSQEILVSGKSSINVTLEEETIGLEEVVTVGYGSVKKSDLTGAIASVSTGTITDAGRTSAISAIQGVIPGVEIQQNSSRAGGDPSIIIRGQNSISGDPTPLYVVDGVVTNSIAFLNPQDIEKIDILKDASSTAIYGSRGANGVVLVQTKSGENLPKGSKPAITYDGYYGISEMARLPEFMDSQEWMQFRTLGHQGISPDANGDIIINKAYLAYIWVGRQTLNSEGQPLYANGSFSGSQFVLNKYLNNETTNWPDLVTQNGQQQNHYINISGSTKDVSYVVGIGYQDEEGIFIRDNYNRYNLKGSISARLDNHWSVGFNFNSAYSERQSGSNHAMLNAFRMSPVVVPYSNGNLDPTLNDLDGNLIIVPGKTTEDVRDMDGNQIYPNSTGTGGFTSSVNPLVDLKSSSNEERQINIIGNVYLQYSPIRNLSLKTTLAPSVTTARQGLYESSLADANYKKPPVANVENNQYITYTWDNQVNYQFAVNNNHHFNVMGLFSVYGSNMENYLVNTFGYNYDYEWYNLGAATSTGEGSTKVSSSYQKITMLSGAMRVIYSYENKYLVTATIRSDGSSKLAQGYKWEAFPSIALGWRMMEEPFLAETRNWLSNLKLRASFGYTGNNNISPYQTRALANINTYYNFGNINAQGVALGAPASTALTWEKTRELNFGLDYGFLNNRINGTVDIYDRLSSKLLQSITLPLESGGGTMVDNLGKVRNRGIEASLNAHIINSRDLNWSVNAIFSANKNKITNLFGNETNGYTYINSNTQKWIVGKNINTIYGYVYDGVWTADGIDAAIAAKDPRVINPNGNIIACEGQAKVKDFDGNGIDPGDRRVQGHSDPSWIGGFGTTFNFKGFDFTMNLYTAQGMTVFSPFMEEFTNLNDRGRNKLKMDYYVPAGASIIGSDGLFVETTSVHNSQEYPMPSITGGGPYWHTPGEIANDMPGAWVDASYIKVRNISLGYTVPKILNNHIQSLRVYCNVLNPFVFTKYKGFDPEWAGASMNKDNGPGNVTYQLGISLKL